MWDAMVVPPVQGVNRRSLATQDSAPLGSGSGFRRLANGRSSRRGPSCLERDAEASVGGEVPHGARCELWGRGSRGPGGRGQLVPERVARHVTVRRRRFPDPAHAPNGLARAKVEIRLVSVVETTPKSDVPHRGLATGGIRINVMELQEASLAAAAAAFRHEGATPTVTQPDGALHLGRGGITWN